MELPVDIPDCVAWIESSPTEPINMLEEIQQQKQTVINWTHPVNPDIGILIIYNRELTEAEWAQMQEYLTQRGKVDSP